MKKIISILLCAVMLVGFVGCSKEEAYDIEPDITQMRSICQLATLECHYHNVAKSIKTAGTNASNWLEKDREFWIEYTGVVKIGIDMSKFDMDIDGDVVTVYMPEAEVLWVDILEWNEDSYYCDKDGKINPNKITAEEQNAAINDAQNKMETSAKKDKALLLRARKGAEEVIENYIIQIGDLAGKDYQIQWVYEESGKKENTVKK